MKNPLTRAWFLAGWVWASSGWALAEPVDPPNPAAFREQLQADVPASLKWWLPARLRQLEAEQKQLLEKIARLPQHEPRVLPDHIGYHSPIEVLDLEDPAARPSIDIRVPWGNELEAIAFAPAFNPLDPKGGAYAFPKRFEIDVLAPKLATVGIEAEGSREYNPQEWDWVKVVDWIDEDFPTPGMYPVYFGGIGRHVRQIRITTPRVERESQDAYYALGELYLFRAKGGGPGDDMAAWLPSSIEIKIPDSFELPPLWGRKYLVDSVSGLGVPLSGTKTSAEDFLVTFAEEVSSPDPVELVLDLGEVQKVGRIDFWPAAAPYLLAIPSVGFPGKISVELSVDRAFASPRVIDVQNIGQTLLRQDRLMVYCRAYEAQYVRITLRELPEFKGRRILGLGEISVSESGKVLSTACEISAKGLPAECLKELPRLVDGYAQFRRILPVGEWIRGLAQRRPLDRRLAVVEQELARARESWRTLQTRAGVWGVSLLFGGLLGTLGLQRLLRRRALNQLKQSITRDLHDEVGSSLGSITLAVRRMEDGGATPTDLSELCLMAREASASLRDVVWLTEQGSIRLPALMQALVERAERVLKGMSLAVERSPQYPDVVVPLATKRHLVMFFKEAVHNCARHSQAAQVRIRLLADEQQLELTVQDNGCGFDPARKHSGWGLDSMEKRAREIGGRIDLKSQPGIGTTVSLTIPLRALQSDVGHRYKTSN